MKKTKLHFLFILLIYPIILLSEEKHINFGFIENIGQKNQCVDYYTFIDAGMFFLTKNYQLVYSFSLGKYNPQYELIIDPLISSTYLGGSGDDDTYEPMLVTDSQGNIFVTGYTYSYDFPTTMGAYSNDFNGYTDRFIAKFNQNMDSLLACTFIGGSNNEYGMGICIDEFDQVYISGYTYSDDFPTTNDSYCNSLNGYGDVFVSKFSNDLTQLLSSTFIGGSNIEGSTWPRIDMSIDELNNIYITGLTLSNDFPMMNNSYDKSYNEGVSGGDLFIIKLDSNLENLLASTYLGGYSDEWRPSIIIDDSGYVFICGETQSPNFPTTADSYNNTFNGGISDAFICKFSNDLSTLLASTFIGGNHQEETLCIRKYNTDIYIGGYTKSINFPTTNGVYNNNYNGGERDAYIAKLNSNLSELKNSTFIGGQQQENINDILVNQSGVYATGRTSSYDFPTTEGAYDQVFNGGTNDAFICMLNFDLSELKHSTYIGGSGDDESFSIAINQDDNLILAGLTGSYNFPTTENSYCQDYNGGDNDLFSLIIDKDLSNSTLTRIDHQIKNGAEQISIFPNPVGDQIHIKFGLSECKTVVINIYNGHGKEVLAIKTKVKSGYHEYIKDVSTLKSGFYTIEFIIDEQPRITNKIIKL